MRNLLFLSDTKYIFPQFIKVWKRVVTQFVKLFQNETAVSSFYPDEALGVFSFYWIVYEETHRQRKLINPTKISLPFFFLNFILPVCCFIKRMICYSFIAKTPGGRKPSLYTIGILRTIAIFLKELTQ